MSKVQISYASEIARHWASLKRMRRVSIALSSVVVAAVISNVAGCDVPEASRGAGPNAGPSGRAQVATQEPRRITKVPAPPEGYFVLPEIGRQPDTRLRLEKVSEKRNQIIDDKEWWINNRLSPLTYNVPNPLMYENGNLPSSIPADFEDAMAVEAIPGHPILVIYGEDFSKGRYLVAVNPDSGTSKFALDFSLYEWPRHPDTQNKEFVQMRITWAQLEGDILYVAYGHNTYAKYSHGQNAYVCAINVRHNKILWHSQPLVCNSGNFLLVRDAIISGYGFTGEPDYLLVLNKGDGRVVQRVRLKSAPSHLVQKEDYLYVRTYDTDYVYRYGDDVARGGNPP